MAQITLKIMTYFEALVRLGSVSEAARHLSVSEPAMMKKVEEFQRGAEVPLYNRNGDTFDATSAGLEIAERMRKVLQQTHEIELFASRAGPALTGNFRLGVIPTIGPYLLPALLPRLQPAYPQLNLEIRETRTKALLEELSVGAVDALLLALPVDLPDVSVVPLFEDPLVLARRRGTTDTAPMVTFGSDEIEPNGLDPRAVDPGGLILLEDGHCLREHALLHCGVSQNVQLPALGTTSLATVIQLVSNGLGETLLPQMALKVESRNPDLEIVQFKDPVPSRKIGLVYRTGTVREQDIEALGKAIQDARLSDIGSQAAE